MKETGTTDSTREESRLGELAGQPVTLTPLTEPELDTGVRLTLALRDGSARLALYLGAAVAQSFGAAQSAPVGEELAACAASLALRRHVRSTEVRVEAVTDGVAPPASAAGDRTSFRAALADREGALVIDVLPRVQGAESAARPTDVLLGLEMPFAVTLGSMPMELRQIQALGQGALVPLGKAADAPVHLVVAGRVVARGELVVVDGCFGIRVTSVETAERRLTTLAGY